MTLDEAIKHAEEVADLCEYEASKYDMSDSYESHVACQEGKCANEHRQLAEWLKDYKRLLEQQPCDAISREAVLSKIKEVCFSKEWTQFRVDNGSNGQRDFIIDYIEQLPSATQKSGGWIPCSERLPEEYGEYLITWKNPKYPKTYIGICECEITDTYDCEHHRFEVEWLFDGHITTAYPDSYVIAWMPLPKPARLEEDNG